MACRATGYSREKVEECIGERFEQRPLPLLVRCVRPGLHEVLDLGIQCAVFSDYDPAPKLQAMGLASRFAAARWAGEARVRALKPHPKGLKVLLEEFGVEAGRALFVGDREEVDGAAARVAGMGFELIGEEGFGALARRIVTQYAQ